MLNMHSLAMRTSTLFSRAAWSRYGFPGLGIHRQQAACVALASVANTPPRKDHGLPAYSLHHRANIPLVHSTPCRNVSCKASSQDASSPEPPSQSQNTVLTLPTILTIGRVVAIPFLIAAWFWESPLSTPTVTTIFIAAAITDWLDGYLARKLNASSKFGAFLDPVADKLMVTAILILLSTQPISVGPLAGNDWLIPLLTLAMIGREITMSALREWAATLGAEARQAVAVNAWGKWKTASQMVSLTLLLLIRDGGSGPLVTAAAVAGPVLLCVAAFLTVYSLIIYLRGLWRFMV